MFGDEEYYSDQDHYDDRDVDELGDYYDEEYEEEMSHPPIYEEDKGKEKGPRSCDPQVPRDRQLHVREGGVIYCLDMKEIYDNYIRTGYMRNPYTGAYLEQDYADEVFEYDEKQKEEKVKKEVKEEYELFDPTLHEGCDVDEDGFVTDPFTYSPIPKGRLITVKTTGGSHCFDIDTLWENYVRTGKLEDPLNREKFPQDIVRKIKEYGEKGNTIVIVIPDESKSVSVDKNVTVGEVIIAAVKRAKGVENIDKWGVLIELPSGETVDTMIFSEKELRKAILDLAPGVSSLNVILLENPPKPYIRLLREFIELGSDKDRFDMLLSLTRALGENFDIYYQKVTGIYGLEGPMPEDEYYGGEYGGGGYYDPEFAEIANIPDIPTDPWSSSDSLRRYLQETAGQEPYLLTPSRFLILLKSNVASTIAQADRQAQLIKYYLDKNGLQDLFDSGFPTNNITYQDEVAEVIKESVTEYIKNKVPTKTIQAANLNGELIKLVHATIDDEDFKTLAIADLISDYKEIRGEKMTGDAMLVAKSVALIPYISDHLEKIKCQIMRNIFSSNSGFRSRFIDDYEVRNSSNVTPQMKKCLGL